MKEQNKTTMDQQNETQRVPPFVKNVSPRSRSSPEGTMGEVISMTMMGMSLLAISVAMVGAAKTVIDVLGGRFSLFDLPIVFAQSIALVIAYMFGWVIALVCVRYYKNKLLPIFVNIYAWVSVLGISLLYMRIILRLYQQQYDSFRFFLYLLTMLGGIGILVGLHLIVQGHDLRMFSLPILGLSVIQLVTIVVRYVFDGINADPGRLIYDVIFFALMISLSILMLTHLGMMARIRSRIDGWFTRPNKDKPA